MILDKINRENDIKKLKPDEYQKLAEEIRHLLIDSISECGGHLASNLGVVELTMAIHLIMDFPNDKLIFDVGHQAYTHKILTGRKDEFDKLRRYGGISGFPKRRESKCDSFDTGHSSTSLSAGLGIVTGYELSGNTGTVISVIGDGALTGGMAYEALNNASMLKRNYIMVLNDNEMSISENVGGMSRYLAKIRTGVMYNGIKNGVSNTLNKIPIIGEKVVHQISKTKSSIKQLVIPGMFFENMDITYLGPVDGHNIEQMRETFLEAKKLDHAVIVHVITKKGKGYTPAENHPSKYHGIDPFDKKTGETKEVKENPTYTEVFSKTITMLAAKNKKITAITAAMPQGTGLKLFKSKFPKRFFDVGIAEEHAVTFAAGLSLVGYKPYVAIYSSFLQRAYDQILHDVCIQDLPVVFIIDRAGLVGGDGETHQGIFDLSYLNSIPNMSIFAPKNKDELIDILKYSTYFSGPLAIRFPRGEAYDGLKEFRTKIRYGRFEYIYLEKDIALICAGSMVQIGEKVRENLKKLGHKVSLINARFIKPMDEEGINNLTINHKLIVVMEENVVNGGFGENVIRYMSTFSHNSKVLGIAAPNAYLEHGDIADLRKEAGLSEEIITKRVLTAYNEK